MSRGIKDLREIICVSRSNGIDSISTITDVSKNGYKISESKKLLNKKKNTKRNSPVTVCKEDDEFNRWYRMINEDILKEMLSRSNKDLEWLCNWAQEENVRVHFMHWWLAVVPSNERKDLMDLEYEIVCAEVLVAIRRGGCGDAVVAERATKHLLSMVMWEYPHSIATHVFLGYLDTLVSPSECKHLLSAVTHKTDKCTLTSKDTHTAKDTQTINCCLAVRAFALLSLWTAIVRFHHQLLLSGTISLSPLRIHPPPGHSFSSLLSISLSHEFIAVLQYWIQQKKIDVATFQDLEGRNLVVLAVCFKSQSVVKYLVENFDVSSIINAPSNTGNSALHVAVCQGSLELVRILVDIGHAQIDVTNADCEDCTPLHMAAIYGHEDIAKFLIERGADSGAKTARNCTTEDMAAVFQETEMADLLSQMRQGAEVAENGLNHDSW